MSEETIPQMREALDKANERIKDLENTNGDLSTENRRLLARDLAVGQGYDASRGDLFASANPDSEITAEALDSFVTQFNLGSTQAEGEEGAGSGEESGEGDQTQGASDGSEALGQMSRGGSRPGDSAGGAQPEMMTRQDWQELHANDPIAAQEAVRQGRVEISKGNPFGDAKSVARGSNPYRTE